MKILLIEDNEDDKLILEEVLSADFVKETLNIEIQIDWAQTLGEACNYINNDTYDIALLDLSLPDSQGIKSIRDLQELEKSFAIIVITGNEEERVGIEAVRLGADDYLLKSQYSQQSLIRNMLHAIERRKTKDTLAKTQSELLEAKLAAESASDAKTVFLAMMSHEFRTPLQNMLGFLNLLEDTPLNEEQREYLWTALNNLEKLEVLVDDIVDYSKVEKGTMAIAKKPYSPAEIFYEAINLVEKKMQGVGPSITTEVFGQLPHKVIGDAGRLLQVLNNLLTNAKKFTPDDGRIHITVKPEKQSEGYQFAFAVEDTGCGITQEDQELLFVPFKQVNPDKDQSIGGTGLGLAICQRLCRLMQGDIKIVSRSGFGTKIYFTIQVEECIENNEPDTIDYYLQGHEQIALKKQHPLNILVAEDDADGGIFLMKQLKKLGHRPHLEKNGQAAVEKLSQEAFDVVLMDVRMPIMNGHAATQAIRKGEAGETKASIPIIGISANTSREDIRLSLEAGMNDFVPKPIRVGILEKKIIETFEEVFI